MSPKIAILAAIGALAAAPAFAAGQWDAAKAVCADAIATEAGVDAAGHDATLDKARDGATKRLTVSLSAKDGSGAKITGECKMRGGEVKSVELDA
ncbi:MAG: hypothetical protein RIC52_05140 [Amphiplicatus sp.]